MAEPATAAPATGLTITDAPSLPRRRAMPSPIPAVDAVTRQTYKPTSLLGQGDAGRFDGAGIKGKLGPAAGARVAPCALLVSRPCRQACLRCSFRQRA